MASRRRNRRTQRKQRGGGIFDLFRGKAAPVSGPGVTSSEDRYRGLAGYRSPGLIEPPLHSAVAKGDVVAVRRLIDEGADVNKISSGMKPLDIATNEEIKALLRENGGTPTTVSVGGRRRRTRRNRRSCRRSR